MRGRQDFDSWVVDGFLSNFGRGLHLRIAMLFTTLSGFDALVPVAADFANIYAAIFKPEFANHVFHFWRYHI